MTRSDSANYRTPEPSLVRGAGTLRALPFLPKGGEDLVKSSLLVYNISGNVKRKWGKTV